MVPSKPIACALASVALMLAPACTSTPPPMAGSVVQILDPEELFSAADWTLDLELALVGAGWGDRLNQVKTHMNETTGWPKNLAAEETRFFNPEIVKGYRVEEIARLKYYEQDAVILHARALANTHMPDGWKPAEDFFLIMGIGALEN